MSIFASRTQKTLDLACDPPHTVTIQRVAGRHLEKAQLESQIAAADTIKRMGGAAFQRELADANKAAKATAAPVEEATRDPLNLYDRYVLLAKGIVAWSYEEPVDPAHIEDLSDEPAEFIAREILRLSKPSLFHTDAEEKAARKNA